MIDAFLGMLGAVIIASLVAGVWQALRSRTRAEAMLAVQIAGTATAGALLLIGPSTIGLAAALDLVIVVAALAAVTAISFVAFGWEPADPPAETGAGAHDDRP